MRSVVVDFKALLLISLVRISSLENSVTQREQRERNQGYKEKGSKQEDVQFAPLCKTGGKRYIELYLYRHVPWLSC